MPYAPNQAMRNAARRALEYRKTLPDSRKFGTAVGIARARDIARGAKLSKRTIMRMRSFLARHRKNYEMYKGKPLSERGSGYWSYLLWGGPAAVGWTNDKIKRYKRAGE